MTSLQVRQAILDMNHVTVEQAGYSTWGPIFDSFNGKLLESVRHNISNQLLRPVAMQVWQRVSEEVTRLANDVG